jgi:ATP-dependent RNA helicase RhlE
MPERRVRPIRALVVVPTRELAIQVEESVRTYGRHRPVRSLAIYGGVGFDPQVRRLREGVDLVVATPGRLLDHVRQGTIRLGSVEFLVLDEADRMLDMGFLPDIRRILELLPRERQSLLFSATFPEEIRALAAGLLRDPASVQVAPRNTAAELVRQVVHPVDRERKRELLWHLVRSGRIYQALVFTRTKHGANRLAEQLERDGIRAAAIHGNKSQSQRVRALDAFKANKVAVLVATDIAARGIDIDALPHVVNFELPMVAEDYVHRIGRTGRAGAGGEAISLVCVDEARLLRDIEALQRQRIPSEAVAGFAPDPRIRPEPILRRSGGGGGRPGNVPRVARPVPGARDGGPVHGGRQVPGARDGGPTYAGRPAPRRHDEHAGHASPGRARREEDRHAAVPAVDRSERPWRPVTSLPGERLARDTRGTPHGPAPFIGVRTARARDRSLTFTEFGLAVDRAAARLAAAVAASRRAAEDGARGARPRHDRRTRSPAD